MAPLTNSAVRRQVPEHLITGERDHHRQRQVADPRIGVKPLLVIHARSAGETAAAILVAENPYHVGSVAEALADGVVLQMRLLRQHHAVAVDDVQGAVFADVEAVEQLIEVVEFHRRHRHSGEFAGFRGDPPTEADAPLIGVVAIAAGLERATDEHAGIAVEGVGKEVIAIGEVAWFGFDPR